MGLRDLAKKILGNDEDDFNTSITTDGCGDETPSWKERLRKMGIPC